MKRTITQALSVIVGFVVLTVPAFAAKFPKRDGGDRPSVERTKPNDRPPEMQMFDERALFKKLGNENAKLVDMVAKCKEDLFCLVTLIKARDERHDERNHQEAVIQILNLAAVVVPGFKVYLEDVRDEAAKSGDQVFAGKFAVAVEQVNKTLDILKDLQDYNRKKRAAAKTEDEWELAIPSHIDEEKK